MAAGLEGFFRVNRVEGLRSLGFTGRRFSRV